MGIILEQGYLRNKEHSSTRANGKYAMVIGVGQCGYFLCKHLIEKGYKVVGVNRRSSQPRKYLSPLLEIGVELVCGDVTDYSNMEELIIKYRPTHIFNMSAQSDVGVSFSEPINTTQIDYIGVLNLLEIICHNYPHIRLLQASTSEMFGSQYDIDENGTKYQDEKTPLIPNSPYAIAKLAAHHAIRLYRESYQLKCCASITFNNESERRGENFVTRKITTYIGKLVANGKPKDFEKLKLGNIDSYRDWSYSSDVTLGMIAMLEAERLDDYVIGSGRTNSVRDFLLSSFSLIGENWEDWVVIDKSLFRPSEVPYLRSKPDKIKKELGWESTTSFEELVKIMVEYDIKRAETKMKLYGSVC